jgi:hypothetical protein
MITPVDFKAEFRAFRLMDDAYVQAKLDEAYIRCSAPCWGLLRDRGAAYLAAHLCASDPMSEPSARQAVDKDGHSSYWREWERLLAQVRIFGTVPGIETVPPSAPAGG